MPSEKRAHTVDIAVIGAGTAGLAAYRAATAAGERAILIESGSFGTTCARVGCMPSKLLVAAAEAAHHARHAGRFGVHAAVTVVGREVMDRVRRERDRFVGFVLSGVEAIPNEHKLLGYAEFVAPGELAVGDVRVHAKAVVIATGSSPVIPSMLEALGDRLVINDDVFSWEDLPASVVVFGSGVIGLELGQALARLGVRVRVLGRGGALAGLSDPDVARDALRALRSELSIEPNATVLGVSRRESEVVVRFKGDDGNAREESFDYALAAAGRRPNVQKLHLEKAGVVLNAKGIPLYDRTTLLCAATATGASAEPVFLAGDVNDDVTVLHEAADEGRIAGENAARFPDVRSGLRSSTLSIVFTEPQIAVVGTRFKDLPTDAPVVTGEVSFIDQGRSRVMLQNHGLLHVYADARTGLFLGAELAGPRAEHLGHLLAWAH